MEKRKPAMSFRDLDVWQKAHQLVLGIYKITKAFPKEEMYGLTSQIRRSAASVNYWKGIWTQSVIDMILYSKILYSNTLAT